MPILPTDSIDVDDVSLEYKSLCTLCQNGRPCMGSSNFVQKNLFYNFDEITAVIYPKPNAPRSADAFYLKNGKIHFIEIKDRKVDDLISRPKIQREITEKLFDSIYTVIENPLYFQNLNISSFNLLYSHIKRNGTASVKINLRGLGNTVGITISDGFVRIPIRAINLYSTHIQKHHRKMLVEPKEMIIKFKLCFCDSIDGSVLQ